MGEQLSMGPDRPVLARGCRAGDQSCIALYQASKMRCVNSMVATLRCYKQMNRKNDFETMLGLEKRHTVVLRYFYLT